MSFGIWSILNFFREHPYLKLHICFVVMFSNLARFVRYEAHQSEQWSIVSHFEFDRTDIFQDISYHEV